MNNYGTKQKVSLYYVQKTMYRIRINDKTNNERNMYLIRFI